MPKRTFVLRPLHLVVAWLCVGLLAGVWVAATSPGVSVTRACLGGVLVGLGVFLPPSLVVVLVAWTTRIRPGSSPEMMLRAARRFYVLGFYSSVAMGFGLGAVLALSLGDAFSSMNVAQERLFFIGLVLLFLGAAIKSALFASQGAAMPRKPTAKSDAEPDGNQERNGGAN